MPKRLDPRIVDPVVLGEEIEKQLNQARGYHPEAWMGVGLTETQWRAVIEALRIHTRGVVDA